MKTTSFRVGSTKGMTLTEVLIAMSIGTAVIGMALGTFVFGLKTMYRDLQRLSTNASLRSFTAQITKETLDASYFYLFDYYTKLDGSVNLATDPITPTEDPETAYVDWISNGDCIVLVTNTTVSGVTKIKQVRIYYRVTTNQTSLNNNAALRYYETQDWGVNGHPDDYTLTQILNGINLNSNPALSGSKLITDRCRGRFKPDLVNRYPAFSTESPSANPTNGFISLNIEFITGNSTNNLLSSSSFNYTISPRR